MPYVLAILLIVAGVIACGIAIVAAYDPEGRGGNLLWMFTAGVASMALGAIWLLWLGWMFVKSLPFF